MNESLKKLSAKVKNPKIMLIAGLIGMTLICISSFAGKKSDGKKASYASDGGITAEEYRLQLEENIKSIVKEITGSSDPTVVVTLESGISYSYADVNEGSSADKTESNSKSTSSENKQSYITVKSADGGEQALLVTTQMPQVRGVAIVCRGGDDEPINEKIQNAVTAALNITSKRVYIAGGSSDEKR